MLKFEEELYMGTAKPSGGGGGSAVIEELNVTPTISAQVITAGEGVDGYSPVNVSAVTSSIDANIVASNIVDGITILGVTGSATELNGTTLNVTPTTSAQTITPTSPNNGFTEVDVDAVTSSIDANIQAGNIKNGVNILGVTGNVNALVGQTKSVSQNGVVTPDAGYNGLTSVSVNVPSKLIKANYWIETNGTISNIKSYDNSFIVAYNETTINTSDFRYLVNGWGSDKSFLKFDLSAITTINSNNAFMTAFQRNAYIKEFDFYSLTSITGTSAFNNCFDSSSIENVNFPNLASISGDTCFQYCFRSCTSLTKLSMPSLTSVTGSYAMANMLSGCTSLTSLDLSSLTTISTSRGLNRICENCSQLQNVNLSSLTNINAQFCMGAAFADCTSLSTLSFPALTSSSFGSYTDQFNNMLGGVTGCTVHFPSNLQSIVGNWTMFINGFGGTNTTILFDLPATS